MRRTHSYLTRVVFGGIAAGLVVNAIELLFHRVLLDKQWMAAFASLGKKPTGWTTFIPSNFLLGSFAVALYAWLRPRCSPTWKSAALAGSAIWLAFWVIPTMAPMPLNLLPNLLLLAIIGIGVFDLLLAVPVGIWLYEER
jgi:hypothetical protein